MARSLAGGSCGIMRFVTVSLIFLALAAGDVRAQNRYSSSEAFAEHARKLREQALLKVEPQVFIPTVPRKRFSQYPWKKNIVTTVFWVGEKPTQNNPVPNDKSSWDTEWAENFGGTDHPRYRKGYRPAAFVPQQNPFYIALPYNDVTRGSTKPEARKVIPWFKEKFVRPGRTVLKGRWLAIRKGKRICYAQWEDCGPFRTDHWEYVFGDERPKPNLNKAAGLDVSPAVRDYLDLSGIDTVDWRFVEFSEVPHGPWSLYGDNNPFVTNQSDDEQLVSKD